MPALASRSAFDTPLPDPLPGNTGTILWAVCLALFVLVLGPGVYIWWRKRRQRRLAAEVQNKLRGSVDGISGLNGSNGSNGASSTVGKPLADEDTFEGFRGRWFSRAGWTPKTGMGRKKDGGDGRDGRDGEVGHGAVVELAEVERARARE